MSRVGNLHQPLLADFGQPELDGLSLGAGDGRHQAQNRLGLAAPEGAMAGWQNNANREASIPTGGDAGATDLEAEFLRSYP
jgi:hypothetical protein